MKLRTPPKSPLPKKREPSQSEGSRLFSFRLPDSLKAEMDETAAEAKKFKVKTSYSLLIRNGITNELAELRQKINKAKEGAYHAKQRK